MVTLIVNDVKIYAEKLLPHETMRVANCPSCVFMSQNVHRERNVLPSASVSSVFMVLYIYTKNFLFTSFSLPFSELSLVGCGWLTIVLHCYDIVGWVSKMTYDVSSGTLNPTIPIAAWWYLKQFKSIILTNTHKHTLLKTYHLCYTVDACMVKINVFLTVMCLEYWALSHCVPAKVQKW